MTVIGTTNVRPRSCRRTSMKRPTPSGASSTFVRTLSPSLSASSPGAIDSTCSAIGTEVIRGACRKRVSCPPPGTHRRALRGINPGTAVPLLVVAVLLGFLGGLQLTRALPATTVSARGTVFGSTHVPGGRYSGESWDVDITVPGHGSQIADSHGLYNAVQRTDLPAVTVHM